jgi:hypothetical protein
MENCTLPLSTRRIIPAILLFCASSAFPRGSAPPVPVFHDSIGEVVDRAENGRYCVFGDTALFIAARCRRVTDTRVDIHAIRDSAGIVQVAVLRLDGIRFERLARGIADRVRRRAAGEGFDAALLPIRRAEWEKGRGTRRIYLRDGSRIIGTFERASGDTLWVLTPGGLRIAVPDSQIEALENLPGLRAKGGRFLQDDPNGSRLFFSPTGRNLDAGEGYFADYMVLFPTLALGVTRYFSISGGMSILPGSPRQLFYIAPKITLRASDRLGFGSGILYLNVPGEDDSNGDSKSNDVQLGYAVATFGSERKAVTLGAGVPFGPGTGGSALVLVGGELQVSSRAKFITENWIFSGEEDFSAFSGGVRFFGEKLAVDLALISTRELFQSGGFPFVPWVDFSVRFGP